MNEPTTPSEALSLALRLAITAPTEAKAAQCAAMAEQIAATLTVAEVESIKQTIEAERCLE
jgi:hypothetical protein